MTIEDHERATAPPDRPPASDEQADAGGGQAANQAGKAGGKKLKNGCDTKKHQMRGRKPKYESRATEIRHRLIAWKQTPESMRPSLRELEAETGISHQLFSFYLSGLDRWQAHERAKRVRAEGRPFMAGLIEAMGDKVEKLRQDAKRGPLNRHQVQMLRLFAKQGFPGAQEILETCRQMTPEEEKQARAFERKSMFASAALKHIERIKQEAQRGPLPRRDIEILKILARRKCVGAKELLQEYSKSALPRPQVPQ